MKYSRVKTGQGLLWSLLGILLYVLAHSIPEWDAPYAAPGRLELSLTLAGLALLLAGAVRSYRASGAGAFAVGGVCAVGALLLQCLQWGLYWHILLPPPLLPIVLGAAGALFSAAQQVIWPQPLSCGSAVPRAWRASNGSFRSWPRCIFCRSYWKSYGYLVPHRTEAMMLSSALPAPCSSR